MLTPKVCKPALAAALFAMAAPSAGASSAYPCFYPEEQQSARIHDFQIMMMVGALKCRDVAPGSVGRYGAMLAQRDEEMAAHGDRLLTRMIDEYGYREGRRAFDDYETTLSNYYSDQRLTREACADLGAYARMTHEAGPHEMETLARLASRRSIDVCEAGSSAARVIPPRVRPLSGAYPERPVVRVIRGAVPPQVAAARVRAEAAAAQEFPDMVSAPVAEPQIEAEETRLAALEADAAAAAAMAASSAATRVAAAEVEAEPMAADQPAASADRLEEAINALDSAANALRNLRDEQAIGD